MKSAVSAVMICVGMIMGFLGCADSTKLTSTENTVPAAQEISNVDSPTNGVDYLVVYGEGLHDAAAMFAGYRTSPSCSTAIASFSDINAAFPFSSVKRPMREFFNFVDTAWHKRPLYILLLGDGGSHGVPTPDSVWYPYDTSGGEVGYYDGGTDSNLAFCVGRIPAKTNDDAIAVLDKIKQFEAALPSEVEFIVDHPVRPDPLFGLFEQSYHDIIANISWPTFSRDSFIVGSFGNDAALWTDSTLAFAKTRLFCYLNSANHYVTYVGYGGNAGLSNRGILRYSDVASLQTINFFILEGSFVTDFTKDTLLARSMLFKKNTGAVGVVGSSAWDYASFEEDFQTAFLQGLTSRSYATIGELFKAASLVAYSISNSNHLLLGDPAMKIRN